MVLPADRILDAVRDQDSLPGSFLRIVRDREAGHEHLCQRVLNLDNLITRFKLVREPSFDAERLASRADAD